MRGPTSVAGSVNMSGMGGAGGGPGGLGPTRAAVPPPSEEDREVCGVSDSVKGEFKSSLHRFCTVITHTIQQLSGDVRLAVPAVTIDDPHAAAGDEEVKAILVDAVEEWTNTITAVVAAASERDKGSRPLQEVEFWRNRSATLSTIYEQLSQPAVKAMLATLELAREPALDAFRAAFAELSKCYVEARDNVKFLNTLERHFKNLATGSLAAMLDTLPSLMNGLRMVWIISRHYNTDEQMLPLMKRIVNELTDRVASEVNVKSILRLARSNPEEALTTMRQARDVLDAWHTTYMAVRER
jgi:dynein heavy chain